MSKIPFLRGSILALALCLCLPDFLLASEGHPSIPGAELSAVWVIPFACMLLSIAIMPLTVPHFWEHHFGKIAVFWGVAFLIPCWIVYGFGTALYEGLHIIILDYIPFIVLLFALFTVAGGVRLTGTLVGGPVVNTGILAVGAILASWMGTTGAAMLLIRPLLKANAHRRYRVHSVVFFIFLVANIGGSLTPLGDPPLFLGFLKGVSFFWTTTHLFLKTLCLSLALLAVFFILDSILYAKEGKPLPPHDEKAPEEKIGIEGVINFVFLAGVVAVVLLSGILNLG
ncbi:MAG: sodium:proton antiporter, partial [Desulfovibrio sp.]|nr:sodium:proton antiporter [Desulfovibrio sp.]